MSEHGTTGRHAEENFQPAVQTLAFLNSAPPASKQPAVWKEPISSSKALSVA